MDRSRAPLQLLAAMAALTLLFTGCDGDEGEADAGGIADVGGDQGADTAGDLAVDTAADGQADAEDDTGPPETVPDFQAASFSDPTEIDNPYFPLVPGTVQVFLAETEDGVETIVVEVLDETREVAGVESRVVRDRVFVEGLLAEDTHDWYAQDDDGNVWYMGEEVDNYEYDDDENVTDVDHEGAWEAGEDVDELGVDALPGYLMEASPAPGDLYHQEYYPGAAEDMAEVVALDVDVQLSDGASYTCLQTRDIDPLEPGADEYKYYAADVGVVLEEEVEGDETVELKGIFLTGDESLPDFEGATFTNPTTIDHPYLPLTPGTTWTYEAETEDGTETIVVAVLSDTREVAGIDCVVVRDQVTLDGLLMEDTHDWFAQDDDGNVWYMGEAVENYEYDDDDNLVGSDDEGSWEAGVDDAVAGIIMWAEPVVGASYRQEYYEDEAEDMAVVVSLDATVELGDGTTYEDCLQTLEWTPVEPDALEYKFYAEDVGVVMEYPLESEEAVELQSMEPPD
jgi:hypothetical protein